MFVVVVLEENGIVWYSELVDVVLVSVSGEGEVVVWYDGDGGRIWIEEIGEGVVVVDCWGDEV